MRLGDDVLVLDRDDRDVETDERPGAAGEIAAARHHVLAGDVAFVGAHQPAAAAVSVAALDGGDRGVTVNLRAAVARAAGERGGQVIGLDVAVLGVADGAD